MTKNAAALFDEAMKLSEDDRHELADRLIFTLSPQRQVEIDRAWAGEVERRVKAVERGEVELIDAEEVFHALEQGKRPRSSR
jgi:putative addiction module component (TIGR02574 family)